MRSQWSDAAFAFAFAWTITKHVHKFQELVQGHCMLSQDYMNDLKKWAVEDYYMKNVHIFELPHTMVSAESQCIIAFHNCTNVLLLNLS